MSTLVEPDRLNPARVKEIFDAVVDTDPATRAAQLEQLCGDDATLRSQVQSLLDALEEAGDFLGAPTVVTANPAAHCPAENLERIGPYRVLRRLGEGGYGTVYLAEQERPIRRTVALKVIKPGMDTSQVIARFELERQTLAMMDHPHIARVFDAGSTESGRPYFVMEYVDGQPVTQYCRSLDLGLDDRLAVFDLVCAAVQHAHRKGVIHRDLKPSNVLVATVDGKPAPKIIDFGIAKALHAGAQADLALTQHALFIGTPQYMSPEQAQGPTADIDTRSDVYSLGVLLYELLTDRPPIDPQKIRDAMLADVPKLLREIEPPPPSSRFNTRIAASAAKSPTGSHASAVHEASLTHSADRIRGDLDWIVMKAMEKDPDRRYPSAEALAADLTRYRKDEPVTAGPPSRAYRFRKFTRRNRRWIVTGAAVLASLLIGLAVATVALFHAQAQRDNAIRSAESEAQQRHIADQQRQFAEQQRQLAEQQRQSAEHNAARVLAAQTFLYRMIAPSLYDDSSEAPPRPMLDFVQGKAGDGFLKDHPEVEAPLRLGLGTAYLGRQVPSEAEKQYKRAIELYRKFEGKESLTIASALHNMGTAILLQNDIPRAKPIFEESLAMYRRLLPSDKIDDAPVMAHVGYCMARTGDPRVAEPLLREALAIFLRSYPPDHPQVQSCVEWLADVYEKLGEKEKAERTRKIAKQPVEFSPLKVADSRKTAIEWIRQNMAFEPDADLPVQVKEQLDRRTAGNSEFTIYVGGDLLKSGKCMRISSVLGQLVFVEMSDEQAAAMDFSKNVFSVSPMRWIGKRLEAEVELDKPILDGGSDWNGVTPLTGKVVIRPHRPLEPGKYALHLTYIANNTSHIRTFDIDATAVGPDKPVAFKFDGIKDNATTRGSPPAVRIVYLDLCRLVYNGKHPDLAVISETRGILLVDPNVSLKQVKSQGE
jgi:serine/threonine protein kinase/tetratricopeptide (TPR) repeat protein